MGKNSGNPDLASKVSFVDTEKKTPENLIRCARINIVSNSNKITENHPTHMNRLTSTIAIQYLFNILLSIGIFYPASCHTLWMPHYILRGHRLQFPKYIVFLPLKIDVS